jgi:hypothetical protein
VGPLVLPVSPGGVGAVQGLDCWTFLLEEEAMVPEGASLGGATTGGLVGGGAASSGKKFCASYKRNFDLFLVPSFRFWF